MRKNVSRPAQPEPDAQSVRYLRIHGLSSRFRRWTAIGGFASCRTNSGPTRTIRAVRKHWETDGKRSEYEGVLELGFLPSDEYEQVLATDVVLSEVFAASANNVVVDCMAHNTPLVINRHPAVVEYLGPDYPLYFDTIREVPQLLSQERVVAAHRYLAARDKSELRGEFFTSAVEDALRDFLAR